MTQHEIPFGAASLPQGGVRFRLWAPAAERVDLRLESPLSSRDSIAGSTTLH